MPENTKLLVRNARDQDLPAVVEIDTEAFTPYGTAEKPERFTKFFQILTLHPTIGDDVNADL